MEIKRDSSGDDDEQPGSTEEEEMNLTKTYQSARSDVALSRITRAK